MCMLTYFPGGQQPDAEALQNGAIWNNDGHGFAIVDGDQIIVRKSMDAEYLIGEFVRMRARYSVGPALFHSRMATHGQVNEYNCHPFYVYHEPDTLTLDTVVGHNGILPHDAQPRKKDPRSDTRLAAEEILGIDFDLTSSKARRTIKRWIGDNNKLVILTVNPAFKENAYIINEHRGVWDRGIWYSNRDFEGAGWHLAPLDNKDNIFAEATCDLCGKLSTGIDNDGFCTLCGTCIACLEQVDDCTCPPVTGTDQDRIDWRAAQAELANDPAVTDARRATLGDRIDWWAAQAELANDPTDAQVTYYDPATGTEGTRPTGTGWPTTIGASKQDITPTH